MFFEPEQLDVLSFTNFPSRPTTTTVASPWRMKRHLQTVLIAIALFECALLVRSFVTLQPRTRTTRLAWRGKGDDDKGSDSCFDDQAQRELSDRLQILNRQLLEQEWARPPNVNCSPEKLVEAILKGLWDSDDPLPDSGFLLLLRTATPSWRNKILMSIGAPTDERVSWEVISSALGAAISRPRNQFGMLVATSDDDQERTDMPYFLDFPFESLDYDDGYSWIECRMRDKVTKELLVITGWSLKQREDDGAWMVDSITWHDLRDDYRPGIGQTEWMRLYR